MKSYLQNNNFQMFSSHDEGKCVVAAKFIRTFKNKIDKYMTYPVSKNMYIDKLFDRVNKYNNTQHKTIKMKLVNVNPSMYIDFNKANNKKGCKFKVGDNVRISKYKNVQAKGYVPNWSAEDFVIKKVKNTVLLTYFFSNLIGKKGFECFTKKNCKKQIKKSLELKSNIREK